MKLLEQAERPLERALILMQMEQGRTTAALAVVIERLTANFERHAEDFIKHRDLTREEAAAAITAGALLDTRLQTHIAEEGSMLTWGLRVFSATCAALVLVIGLGGAFIARYVLDVNERQQTTIDTNSNRLTALESFAKEERDRRGAK
jgi:NaMN:DMB phosphoribosyltransferase